MTLMQTDGRWQVALLRPDVGADGDAQLRRMRQLLCEDVLDFTKQKAQTGAITAVCHPQLPAQAFHTAEQHAIAPHCRQTGIKQLPVACRLLAARIKLQLTQDVSQMPLRLGEMFFHGRP